MNMRFNMIQIEFSVESSNLLKFGIILFVNQGVEAQGSPIGLKPFYRRDNTPPPPILKFISLMELTQVVF